RFSFLARSIAASKMDSLSSFILCRLARRYDADPRAVGILKLARGERHRRAAAQKLNRCPHLVRPWDPAANCEAVPIGWNISQRGLLRPSAASPRRHHAPFAAAPTRR